MTLRAAAIVLALSAVVARADTLGYLRATAPTNEVIIARPKGAARVIVARTQAEWREAWRAAGGGGEASSVDFARQMVVGVVSAAKDDRVVYRIQLDDAAKATALEVHLGHADAPAGPGRTHARTGAHFVVTPRSALPVRFVMDEMIDGRVFATTGRGEGVASTEVGVVPAMTTGATTDKAALREQAEAAVVGALTAAERTKLLVGPLDRPMSRVPHGWTKLEIARATDHWTIAYDDVAFRVDVATGVVTRP